MENGPEMQAYRNSPSWQSEDAISAKQGFDPELLQTASLRVFFGALLVHCPRAPRVPRVPHGGMPPPEEDGEGSQRCHPSSLAGVRIREATGSTFCRSSPPQSRLGLGRRAG